MARERKRKASDLKRQEELQAKHHARLYHRVETGEKRGQEKSAKALLKATKLERKAKSTDNEGLAKKILAKGRREKRIQAKERAKKRKWAEKEKKWRLKEADFKRKEKISKGKERGRKRKRIAAIFDKEKEEKDSLRQKLSVHESAFKAKEQKWLDTEHKAKQAEFEQQRKTEQEQEKEGEVKHEKRHKELVKLRKEGRAKRRESLQKLSARSVASATSAAASSSSSSSSSSSPSSSTTSSSPPAK